MDFVSWWDMLGGETSTWSSSAMNPVALSTPPAFLVTSNSSTLNSTASTSGAGLAPPIHNLSEEMIIETIEEFRRRQLHYSELRNVVLIACYAPLFALALCANALVIFVVFKYHYMRSVTNYFLVNLSVADLLVTIICMPMAVGQSVYSLWVYGEVMCILTSYLQGVSVGASVFTITAMSLDRYLAIRHPMAFRKVFNRKSTIFVIAALWAVSLLIFAPLLWVRKTASVELGDDPRMAAAVENYGLKYCFEDWPKPGFSKSIYGALCFILVYAIPGSVVMVAYSLMGRRLCAVRPPFDEASASGTAANQQGTKLVRERRRVARILLLLAVLFALCWLPYNLMSLSMDLELDLQPLGLPTKTVINVSPFALLLGHANSAINPLLYCFMTRNFRRSMRELLGRRLGRACSCGCSCGCGCGCGRLCGRPPMANRCKTRCKIQARGTSRDAGRVAVCTGSSGQCGGSGGPGGPGGAGGRQRSVTTTSSGYASSHSPHRRCYVLRLQTLKPVSSASWASVDSWGSQAQQIAHHPHSSSEMVSSVVTSEQMCFCCRHRQTTRSPEYQ